ncbi:hypothetical protein [Actinoplanes sp. ATCC 53533]|uniref:hypothetical protein n=1 Tax=Actinoplanes sp. ATCC 53533 TaxID=1288362 RepID=UPI0018F5F299|nr:hypothetical protein [Actinoplanes sp. ATCC 53533]
MSRSIRRSCHTTPSTPGYGRRFARAGHRWLWFLGTVDTFMASLRKTGAEPAAQHFVMLRDGAMATGCLFDRVLICATFLGGVEELIRAHTAGRPSA